ncbi:hypothetical protein RI367_001453 [Sorochytrium milnesiophthora]
MRLSDTLHELGKQYIARATMLAALRNRTAQQTDEAHKLLLLAVTCLEAAHEQEQTVPPAEEISHRLETVRCLWSLCGAVASVSLLSPSAPSSASSPVSGLTSVRGLVIRAEAHLQQTALLLLRLPSDHLLWRQVRWHQLHAIYISDQVSPSSSGGSQLRALSKAVLSECMHAGQWQWLYAFLWQQGVLLYRMGRDQPDAALSSACRPLQLAIETAASRKDQAIQLAIVLLMAQLHLQAAQCMARSEQHRQVLTKTSQHLTTAETLLSDIALSHAGQPCVAAMQLHLSMFHVMYDVLNENYGDAIKHLQALHTAAEGPDVSDDDSVFLSGEINIPIASMAGAPYVAFRMLPRAQLYAIVYLLSAVANIMDLVTLPIKAELFCIQGKAHVTNELMGVLVDSVPTCEPPCMPLFALDVAVQLTRHWAHTLIARGQHRDAERAITELVQLIDLHYKSEDVAADDETLARLRDTLILDLALYAQATGSLVQAAQYFRHLLKSDPNTAAIAKLSLVALQYSRMDQVTDETQRSAMLEQIRRLLDTLHLDGPTTSDAVKYDTRVVAMYKMLSTLTFAEVNKRKQALLDAIRLARDCVQVKALALGIGGYIFQPTNVAKAETMYTHSFHLSKRAGMDVLGVVCWDRMQELHQQLPLDITKERTDKDAAAVVEMQTRAHALLTSLPAQ